VHGRYGLRSRCFDKVNDFLISLLQRVPISPNRVLKSIPQCAVAICKNIALIYRVLAANCVLEVKRFLHLHLRDFVQ
jgi:hypothetical protein